MLPRLSNASSCLPRRVRARCAGQLGAVSVERRDRERAFFDDRVGWLLLRGDPEPERQHPGGCRRHRGGRKLSFSSPSAPGKSEMRRRIELDPARGLAEHLKDVLSTTSPVLRT